MDATLYSVAFAPFLLIPVVFAIFGVATVAADIADYLQKRG